MIPGTEASRSTSSTSLMSRTRTCRDGVGRSGEELNVGSGTEASARRSSERLIEITGSDLEVELDPRRCYMRRRVGATKRRSELLGWEAARD